LLSLLLQEEALNRQFFLIKELKMQKMVSLVSVGAGFIFCAFLMLISASTLAGSFQLSSNSFVDQGLIHKRYTCDAENISPDLSWSAAPVKTKTFALIVSDPDVFSKTFYHWVLYNILGTAKNLKENATQAGITGFNSYEKSQYNGPCPPKGKEHRYIFTLYALDTAFDTSSPMDAKTLHAAMQKHILAEAALVGLYRRG
jgi:Raf kinase inhibitor-like YbhB/YbcL family protein